MVKNRLRLSSKCAKSFDIGLRNKDKKSDPENPNSPFEPVAYPAPKGSLIGIGVAVTGATVHNHVTTDSQKACIFIMQCSPSAL